uniref:Uncharacterized protein n=1 Tax=Glossina palpalis gambiensis TaxID=67801 RepID=A0A1B0C5L9_9MUSC
MTVLKCFRSKAINLLKDTFPQIEKVTCHDNNPYLLYILYTFSLQRAIITNKNPLRVKKSHCILTFVGQRRQPCPLFSLGGELGLHTRKLSRGNWLLVATVIGDTIGFDFRVARHMRSGTTLPTTNKGNIPDCCQVSGIIDVYSADNFAEACQLCKSNTLAYIPTLASANNCCCRVN